MNEGTLPLVHPYQMNEGINPLVHPYFRGRFVETAGN
jgi:hypothetical protein